MDKMKAASATVDGRTAWIVAGASLAILTIAYGAPLLSAVALRPIAAELGTERAAPAAASALTLIGAAFGGIAAGWLSGWLGIRWIVLFGGAMIAAGLVLSASGGLVRLTFKHLALLQRQQITYLESEPYTRAHPHPQLRQSFPMRMFFDPHHPRRLRNGAHQIQTCGRSSICTARRQLNSRHHQLPLSTFLQRLNMRANAAPKSR